MIRSPAGFDGVDRIKRYLDYYQPSYGVTMLSAGQFSPLSLFAAGEPGAWYDPTDFSTMFQDSAGTTPVTATGQSVGLILDKSGRGNNAFQTTPANRPVLNQDAAGNYYLTFSGSNGLQTNTVTFNTTSTMSVFSGVRKLSDANISIFLELSAAPSSTSGSFGIYVPITAGTATYSSFSRGGAAGGYATTAASYAAPVTNVLTALFSISADQNILRLNGVQAASATNDQGVGNYSNNALFIGRRSGGTFPMNARLYSLIIRGATSTTAQINNTEAWVNQRCAAY